MDNDYVCSSFNWMFSFRLGNLEYIPSYRASYRPTARLDIGCHSSSSPTCTQHWDQPGTPEAGQECILHLMYLPAEDNRGRKVRCNCFRQNRNSHWR